MVLNIHKRILKASTTDVWEILDSLASKEDKLWPRQNWPAMKFDSQLKKGSKGGHGPIHYFVESYAPENSIVFRFISPKGFDGIHGFYIKNMQFGLVMLEHRIEMNLKGYAKLTWPIIFRPLHDALIEDALDSVGGYFIQKKLEKRTYSLWVNFLRWVIKKQKK